MNLLMCPWCRMDSGLNHENGCPMHPNRIGQTTISGDSGQHVPTDTERLEWLMDHMRKCGMAPQSREYIDWAMRGFS